MKKIRVWVSRDSDGTMNIWSRKPAIRIDSFGVAWEGMVAFHIGRIFGFSILGNGECRAFDLVPVKEKKCRKK